MKKRAHKVLGIELRNSNLVRVADPVGKVERIELDWTALSGAQQGKLEGRSKNRLGQS
jgi:hypothetical protein